MTAYMLSQNLVLHHDQKLILVSNLKSSVSNYMYMCTFKLNITNSSSRGPYYVFIPVISMTYKVFSTFYKS